MGENGAGKSTLMQCIAGVQRPEEGQLVFEGKPLDMRNTRDANKLGIPIVFQELVLAPNMSIAENVVLGMEPRAGKIFVDRTTMRKEPARSCTGSVSTGRRQNSWRADDRAAAAGRNSKVSCPSPAIADLG